MFVRIINWLKAFTFNTQSDPETIHFLEFFFSPCSGLVVTSFHKHKHDTDTRRKIERKIYSSFGQYTQFKKMYEINAKYEGELKEQSFKTNILL